LVDEFILGKELQRRNNVAEETARRTRRTRRTTAEPREHVPTLWQQLLNRGKSSQIVSTSRTETRGKKTLPLFDLEASAEHHDLLWQEVDLGERPSVFLPD
jgi:hypothetical protein